MAQLDLYTEINEKKTYRFFCALNKSVDGKVLKSNILKYPQKIKQGTRLIIERHKEKGSPYSNKRTWRYRLFLDESRADTLPRGDVSKVQKTEN